MEQAEQAEGEKRVREVLIDPLRRLGLAKPSALSKGEFVEMQKEICAKLAYMDHDSLLALREEVASKPAGPSGDRFPIGAKILGWATKIQAPPDDIAPFARAVLRHAISGPAFAEGWTPELLAHLKRTYPRVFPSPYDLAQIKAGAREALRRMADLELAVSRGRELAAEDKAFYQRRRAALDRCRQIADMAKAGEGVA